MQIGHYAQPGSSNARGWAAHPCEAYAPGSEAPAAPSASAPKIKTSAMPCPPEAECISKCKARISYELGVEVSIATTLKEGQVSSCATCRPPLRRSRTCQDTGASGRPHRHRQASHHRHRRQRLAGRGDQGGEAQGHHSNAQGHDQAALRHLPQKALGYEAPVQALKAWKIPPSKTRAIIRGPTANEVPL